METFSLRGGMRAGWVHSSWPLARLSVSPDRIYVEGLFVGRYEFGPTEVVALEPVGLHPLLGGGVRILHTRPDYPRSIVFGGGGSSQALVDRIRQAGFIPSASSAMLPPGRGIAVRWWVLLLAIALWNVLFLLDGFYVGGPRRSPGPLTFCALALVFLGTLAVKESEEVQAVVLRPGRSVGEIGPFLSLLQIVSGLMLLLMGVFAMSGVAG